MPQRTTPAAPVRRAPALRTAVADSPRDPVLEFIRRMWSVDHELQRVSKRMVRRLGLTAPQRLAVRFIGRHAGLTLGDLSSLLHLHPGTVTGIVRHLEAQGLVTQSRDTEDSRRRHLVLTPKGKRLDRQRKGTVEAAVRRVAGVATAAEMATAGRVLGLIAKSLADE